MKKRHSVTFILIFLVSQNLTAQVKLSNVGIGMRVGFSQNMRAMSKNSSLESLAPVFSYSFIGYGIFDFKSYNLDRSNELFPCLKVDLVAASRGGVFDVEGVATRLQTTTIDLEATFPIAFPVSESLQFYFGVGGIASFLISNSDGAKMTTISPGAIVEAGVSTSQGSYLGFNLLGIYGEYSMQSLSFTFGMPLIRR